jgi:hypothetical protein
MMLAAGELAAALPAGWLAGAADVGAWLTGAGVDPPPPQATTRAPVARTTAAKLKCLLTGFLSSF